MARRVLHLGWGHQAIGALRRLGVDVVCTATADQAEAATASGVEVVVVQDPGSVADTLAGLGRLGMLPDDFERVCSGLEHYIVQAGVVSQLAGGHGLSWQQGLGMRDKAVQKQLVSDAGIPTARCRVIDRLSATDRAAVDLPAVLKPLDGAGTKHTVKVRTAAELDEAIAELGAVVDGPWLLESFTPGRELFVDAVVRGGDLRLCAVSRYVHNLIDIRDGGMVGYLAVREADEPELYARARAFTLDSVAALSCPDAVVHLEMFDDDGTLVFGECGARVGGGRVDKLVELAWGVDLHDEWARVVLDLPSSVPTPASQAPVHYGGMNVRCATGAIVSMPSEQDVLARDGVVDVDLRVRAGRSAPDHRTASNARAGQLILGGASAQELAARMKDVDDWFYASVVTR